MSFSKLLFTFLFLTPFLASFSQNNFPKDYFRSPIDYKIVLSGNFAELRPNHFHSGLDLKTANKIGKRIFAIADGYVSRINVSPFGYGLALYVDHPNGFTSVYGHLYMFNDEIAAFIKAEQYKQKTFALTIYPDSAKFKLKKGDLIAISGNSGHSYGPHLHFEIRDTKTEKPMNTLKFGLPVIDKVKPRFFHLIKYPLTENNRYLAETQKKLYPIKASNGNYYLSPNQTLKLGHKTGFGVRVHDFMTSSPNRVGVYRLEVFLDSSLIYSHQLDKFSFDESRYLNSHVDYQQKRSTNKWTQKCFLEANNQLTIYKDVKNNGIVQLEDFEVHKLKFVATDVHNNVSTFKLKIQRSQNVSSAKNNLNGKIVMPYNKENVFNKEGLYLNFPKDAFYDTLFFKYTKKKKLTNSYSPVYSVHNENIPLHKYSKISIKTTDLPKKLYSKAVIAKVSKSGRFSAVKSSIDSLGIVSAEIRSFGNYTVAVDKTPPYLKALNISENKNISGQKTIEFKTSDSLSGINKYNAYIDGEWVLLVYNYMKKKLIYKIDASRLSKGKHKFEIKVSDSVGNETIKTLGFIY